MVAVTPGVAVVFFVLLLIAVLLVAHYADLQNFEQSKTYIFLLALSSVGVLVTALFYYSVVQLQGSQQRLAVVQETDAVHSSLYTDLQNSLQDLAPVAPQFVFSLNPLLPASATYIDTPDICSPSQSLGVDTVSNKIFSLWQRLISAHTFLDFDPVGLNTYFLQLAHSSYLLQFWYISRANYAVETQKYGNLLFEYGQKVVEQTPMAYQTAAVNMINDVRYSMIAFR